MADPISSEFALRANRLADRMRPPFRGGILGTIANAPMGKGHKNDGKPFDINTACYLKPVFAGIQKPGTRKVVIKAAVKTLKSFVGEAAAVDHLCNGVGDVGIFFGTAEAADDVSTTRILNYFEGVPLYQEKCKTIVGQYDYTIGAVKFPDKTLFIKPANLSNAQQKNLGCVVVQDAFVCEASGMLDQLIDRTTQYPNDKKIIFESQGGEKGFDFDRHFEDTNQGELYVRCPFCEQPHIFNWRAWDMLRNDDYLAVVPKGKKEQIIADLKATRGVEPSQLEIDEAIERARKELTETLKGPNRRRCGFKRGDDELIKLPDGTFNEAAVLRETHYECFHCGSRWDDTPAIREQLDSDGSIDYVPARPDALPENLGFSFPQWINRRLPWGPMMLRKLQAQKLADDFGNFEPLKIWWQKVAGRTWDPDDSRKNRQIEVAEGVYETDPTKLMPDFHSRNMGVDSQKKLDADANEDVVGSFWYVIRDFDKASNSVQRARGFASSWEELLAVQKHWKIPNQRFVIDCSKWGQQIEMVAAMNFELVTPRVPHPITGRRDPYPSGWRLFYGDKRAEFRVNGKPSATSEAQESRMYFAERDGKRYGFKLLKYRWSNFQFEQQLEAILSQTPGMPRYEVLPRSGLRLPNGQPDTITLAKETGILTYEQQMSARYKAKVRGKDHYEDIRNREAHYRDCELEILARVSQDGLLGHVNMPIEVGES